jgi:hypothetical protein
MPQLTAIISDVTTDDLIAFTVRLPRDLHAAIAQLARDELRSVNNQVIVLLREAVQARREREQPGKE